MTTNLSFTPISQGYKTPHYQESRCCKRPHEHPCMDVKDVAPYEGWRNFGPLNWACLPKTRTPWRRLKLYKLRERHWLRLRICCYERHQFETKLCKLWKQNQGRDWYSQLGNSKSSTNLPSLRTHLHPFFESASSKYIYIYIQNSSRVRKLNAQTTISLFEYLAILLSGSELNCR